MVQLPQNRGSQGPELRLPDSVFHFHDQPGPIQEDRPRMGCHCFADGCGPGPWGKMIRLDTSYFDRFDFKFTEDPAGAFHSEAIILAHYVSHR